MTDTVLIIDFGSQVTQLIARRVREAGVYSEIVPFRQRPKPRSRASSRRRVILSGGPARVTDDGTPRAPECVFDAGVPVLGICYGQQTMAEQLGGAVEGGHDREFGRADGRDHARRARCSTASGRSGERYPVWMSHGDRVTRLPPGFKVKATSARTRRSPSSPTRRAASTRAVPPRGGAHAGRRAS